MSAFLDFVTIFSSIDGVTFFLNNTISTITNIFGSVINEESTQTYSQGFFVIYKNLSEYLHFDDFQFKLLKVFLFVLLTNILLVYISWRIYGKRICERFMKPGIRFNTA